MRRSSSVFGALLLAVAVTPLASAGDVWLSLNLALNNPGDLASGGTWTAVAKAEEQGIAGIVMMFQEPSLNFDPDTGFLTPAGFEVELSAEFGLRLEIVQADDLSDPTLDVGVIGGSFPTTYVDPANLAILGANPDLGSFSGGVELATGSFDAGDLPAWYTEGSDASAANLFMLTSDGPRAVAADRVLTTVRYTVPEPGAAILLSGVGLCLAMVRRRQGAGGASV